MYQLDALLYRYRDFWQFQPMQRAWPCHWPPALLDFLCQLDAEQLQAMDADWAQQQSLCRAFFPELAAWYQQTEPSTEQPATTSETSDLPFWWHQGIPGRKWAQILAFDQALVKRQPSVVEWCAGKGYLGMLLAHRGARAVKSLELQADLCAQGQQHADQLGIAQQFHVTDVLQPEVQQLLQAEDQLVALHACGGLHRAALTQAVGSRIAALAVAPCCFHLHGQDHYQPMSLTGQQSLLRLTRADLRMAVQQQATGGARVQRLARQEMLWRHAWWHWQRRQLGEPSYRPLLSLPKQCFSEGWQSFAELAAAHQQLPVPAAEMVPELLQQAEQSLLAQRRLELVQHLFRRALEWWLVLDLANYLQQHHYQVQVAPFCATELTPRNLLLQATRHDT